MRQPSCVAKSGISNGANSSRSRSRYRKNSEANSGRIGFECEDAAARVGAAKLPVMR